MRCAIALLLLATPVAAQDGPANGTRYGAWVLSCEALGPGQTVCALRQTLVADPGDRFVAELLAFPAPDAGDTTWFAARVPSGAYLPSGFALRPHGAESGLRFDWQSCSPDLCEAVALVEDVAGFENGPAIAGYLPGLQAAPAVFEVGMEGLAEGLAALR